MIYFLTKKATDYTIRNFIRYYAQEIGSKIKLLNYEDIGTISCIECSTIIFSDIDRLSEPELNKAIAFQHYLQEKYPTLQLLNKPDQVRLRYDFLRELRQRGLNPHNVHRLSELSDQVRYPVFLREENEHSGALTSLLWSQKDLMANALSLRLQGFEQSNLLAVEYVDIKCDGRFLKKYSISRIGPILVPRQIDYTTTWKSKDPNLESEKSEEYAHDYMSFMTSNRHFETVRAAFDLARIDYGRMDFGLLDGEPVIWEINLNPDFGPPSYEGEIRKTFDSMYDQLRSAFGELANRSLQKIHCQLFVEELATKGYSSAYSTEGKPYGESNLHRIMRHLPFKKVLIDLKRKAYLLIAQCWIQIAR